MTTPPQPSASPAFTPYVLHVREKDGSCFISRGDYVNGRGYAFDIACDDAVALDLIRALNDYERLHAENRELREAVECLLIGACAVGVPHPEERKVLQEAVAIARAALTRHAPNGAGSEPGEEKS